MKLPIRVTEDSKVPIYHQIEHQIKMLIVAGKLSPGTLLPSIRSLSNDLACSVITTRRAYQDLENDGYIKTVQGKGTYVSALDRQLEDDLKKQMVYEEFRKAVAYGEQMGCTAEEMRSFFASAISAVEGKNQ